MFFGSLNVRIYVSDFTQPLIEWREQCYCFVIVPLFRYFFAEWELPSLTLCYHKRSCFRLTQFSTCRWVRVVTRSDGARCKTEVWRPMFETEVFRKCLENLAPSQWFGTPWWLGARGIVPPSWHPCNGLYENWSFFLQVYFFNAWWQPRKERQQWK